MFEQLFSGLKSGLSGIGSGLQSLFAPQQQQPVMSGIPQPTINAQTLGATPQNGKFLTLLNDLAGQYSQAERNQDLYNVLPADQAAAVINQQRMVGMKEDEAKQQNLQRQAISDILKNPSDESALARLEQIASITGDPAAIEKYLVASGKGGSAPAVLQVADAMLATLPPEQRTPEAYNQIIQMVGKYNEKGTTFDFYGAGGTGGYNSAAGGTPGIASPVTPQAPHMPAPMQFPTDGGTAAPNPSYLQMLEPPMLDGNAAAPRPAPQVPQMPSGGVTPLPGAIEAAAARKSAEETAKLQAELGLAPDIEAAKLNAKYIQEGFQTLPKMQRTLERMEGDNKNITRIIGDVRSLADKAATTGYSGNFMRDIAGTDAADLDKNLATLRSTSALGRLQQLKAEGGTLGAVSEKELELLEASYTNLASSQSKPQFLENLKAFEEQNKRALESFKESYKQDYARFGGNRDSNLPAPRSSAIAPRASGGKTGNPIIDKYLE